MRELERPGAESDPPAASGPLDRDAAAPVARPLIIDTVAGLRAALAPVRLGGRSIGLVPTMGAFHEGHASLMRRAGEECDVVVVSLFVNPSQFGPGDDLERYPRDLARDAGIASSVGVDFLFVPSLDEIYPAGFATTVAVAGLGDVLCGAPGRRGAEHFRGVVTVVTKLLNICQPDVAYFGAKDYQQATIVRRAVLDLDMPVQIRVCPTVRDADGLALSSRNAYLSPAERRQALALNRALSAAAGLVASGEPDPRAVAQAATRELLSAQVEPEYVEVVSASDLNQVDEIAAGDDVLIALAATVGKARLIDNRVVQAPKRERNHASRRYSIERGERVRA